MIVAVGIVAVELGTGQPSRAPQSTQAARVSLKIVRVALDQVDAPPGRSFYLLELNVSDSGPAPWEFNPRFLQVVGNDSNVYSTDSSYNETTLMEGLNITEGRYGVGQVAFRLPGGEAPSRLRYNDPESGISLDVDSVPRVSAVASRFELNARLTINGWAVSAEGWTAKTVNGTDRWVSSIVVDGLIQNNSLVFFTGQKVAVDFWFEYLKQPVDPSTIMVTTVTNDDGFQVVSSQPSLPLILTGWGSQTGLVMVLTIPPGQHSGRLSFSTQFSP